MLKLTKSKTFTTDIALNWAKIILSPWDPILPKFYSNAINAAEHWKAFTQSCSVKEVFLKKAKTSGGCFLVSRIKGLIFAIKSSQLKVLSLMQVSFIDFAKFLVGKAVSCPQEK